MFYQRAMALELPAEDVEFAREVWIDVFYKGHRLGRKRVDFVMDEVLLEIKARAEFEDRDLFQTLSYLRASNYKVALLLNSGAKQLQIKRFINEAENRPVG